MTEFISFVYNRESPVTLHLMITSAAGPIKTTCASLADGVSASDSAIYNMSPWLTRMFLTVMMSQLFFCIVKLSCMFGISRPRFSLNAYFSLFCGPIRIPGGG